MRNLTGQRFGQLTAVRPHEGHPHAGKGREWECVCTCGKWVIRRQTQLVAPENHMCENCQAGQWREQHHAFIERKRRSAGRKPFTRELWSAEEQMINLDVYLVGAVLDDLECAFGDLPEEPMGDVDPVFYVEVCTCSFSLLVESRR